MSLKEETILGLIILLLGGIAGGMVTHAWHINHTVTDTRVVKVNVPVPATVAAPVVKIEKETVACPSGVQVYKPAAKEALAKAHALPQPVAADPKEHVLSASEVAPDYHPHAVTSVLDTDTGQVQTFDTRLPYAPLAVDTHRDIAVAYGIRAAQGGHERVIRIEARQDMASVFGVRLGGFLGLDAPVSGGPVAGFVGIGVHKTF